MKCSKSGTCGNYKNLCYDCKTMSAPHDETPYYVEKGGHRVRFKIFFGNHTMQSADDKLNQWLEQNPKVHIVSWQYQQSRIGDHAICIEYEGESE